MTIYYKNGFFDDTDGGFVPESAVEIIQETYLELLNGQAQGKQIIVNKTGHPALIDPQPSTAHQLNLDTLTWEIFRRKTNRTFCTIKRKLTQ
nr:hypothetical protein BV020_01168 [Haemophilus influenzae]PRI86244.1 hypothetical protein BV021_01495 [Haemophilus influenzae]PRJ87361.1 hypothetical protein BV154_01174 [Haemophilus influenzae]